MVTFRTNVNIYKLTTGTLTWEEIKNKAEYKTGGHGISYNGKIGRGDKNDPLDSRTNNRYGKDTITGQRNGMNKITPTIYGSKIPLNERGLLNTPIPSVKGTAGTTTRSAVSKGTITITDKENQKQDIEKLNRNTEDSLNKLKEIFDKTKVEEKQEYVNILSQVGYRLIGDIAGHKENELNKKAEKARKENNSILAEKYEKEAKKWSESGSNRIAMHGIMGALVSKEAGTGMTKGLTGAGLNALLQKELGKIKDKEVHKMASAAIGYLAGGKTGAAIAWQATTFNYLTHEQKKQKEALIAQALEEGDEEQANTIRQYYDELDNKQDIVISNLELPEQDEYDSYTEKMIVQSGNIYDGTDTVKEVTMAGLKLAKKQGLTAYHFGDEDYVTLNGSIGIRLGLSGGFIMDRTGNVYFVRGGGIVNGLSGTIATGKFNVDTSGWNRKDFQQALSGSGTNFSLSLYGSVNINIGERYGFREIGIANGASASMIYTDAKYICNINDL